MPISRPHRRTPATRPAPVKVEPVRQETIRRTVEVVATLAAEAEVTVSSETDGRVSRLLADLGDRVNAGQVLVELDREKQQYNVEEQNARRWRARSPSTAPRTRPPAAGRTHARRPERAGRARPGQAGRSIAPTELHKRQLVPKQTLDDADSDAAGQAGAATTRRCRTPRTCAPKSTPPPRR